MKSALIILLLASTTALAQGVDTYNFKYRGDGPRNVLPTQVFDDGTKTIVQFRPDQKIPAIFADVNGNWEHIVPKIEGAYAYLPLISGQFKMKVGLSEALVVYSGLDRTKNAGSVTSNHVTKRSFLAAAKGDDFYWVKNTDLLENAFVFVKDTAKVTPQSAKAFISIAKKIKNASKIEVVGYSGIDDESGLGRKRADAIINSLTAFGISRSIIQSSVSVNGESFAPGGVVGARIEYALTETLPLLKNATPARSTRSAVSQDEKASSMASKQLYRIEVTDRTILDVLKRWANDSGWELIDVKFPHIQLENSEPQTITYGSFLEAVDKMKLGLHAKGYIKIDGEAYLDKVLKFGVLDGSK